MVNYSLAHMSTKPGVENAPKKYYAKAQATRAGDGGLTFHRVAKKGEAALPDDPDGNGGSGSGGGGGLDENPLG